MWYRLSVFGLLPSVMLDLFRYSTKQFYIVCILAIFGTAACTHHDYAVDNILDTSFDILCMFLFAVFVSPLLCVWGPQIFFCSVVSYN